MVIEIRVPWKSLSSAVLDLIATCQLIVVKKTIANPKAISSLSMFICTLDP